MQTFLPYASFTRSAMCLDRQRLGKQRVEVLQILNALTGKRGGWGNHPITRMWVDTPISLARYGLIVCVVWKSRGYNDTCYEKIRALFPDHDITDIQASEYPSWFGSLKFHTSHQSNLVRKFPEHYRRFFPDVPDNLDYVWPV